MLLCALKIMTKCKKKYMLSELCCQNFYCWSIFASPNETRTKDVKWLWQQIERNSAQKPIKKTSIKIFAYWDQRGLMTNFNFVEWHGIIFSSRLLRPKYNGTFIIELEHECIICVSGKNTLFFFAWFDDFFYFLFLPLNSAAVVATKHKKSFKKFFISETQIMRYNRSKNIEAKQK